MKCQWVVLHRLKNIKPKKRREPCGRRAGLRKISGLAEHRIWLCKYHWRCLGRRLNSDGTPAHPLYLLKTLEPKPYTLPAAEIISRPEK